MKLRGINCKRHSSGDLTISVDVLITGVCYRSTRTNFNNVEAAANYFHYAAVAKIIEVQPDSLPYTAA